MEAARKAFSHRNLREAVIAANRGAGKRFEQLYQRTIDLGVTGTMPITDEHAHRTMLAIFLHGEGPALDVALKTTAQCAVCSLEILQAVFTAHFELLGVNAAMRALKKHL
jgi:hypothetical protein